VFQHIAGNDEIVPPAFRRGGAQIEPRLAVKESISVIEYFRETFCVLMGVTRSNPAQALDVGEIGKSQWKAEQLLRQCAHERPRAQRRIAVRATGLFAIESLTRVRIFLPANITYESRHRIIMRIE
jgi:hypothetical protein